MPRLIPPAPLRRAGRALLVGLVLVSGCHRGAGATAGTPRPVAASLAARVDARIARVPGATVAVVYRPLGGGAPLERLADSSFHAASTMKLPVLVELFRRVDAGALSLDQRVPVVNRFRSIVDGSPYTLDPGADSDSAMYAAVGGTAPLRELAERMIVRSSNLATNTLIALLGAPGADSAARRLGARHTRVLRGVEDGKAFERGLVNTTTAADLAAMLAAVEQGRAASPASSRAIREILTRQEFNDAIPAGLPPGTPVAHKTGQITATLHDAAIVYPPGRAPYVLVVLTRGIPDEAVARTLIADVSRLVWEESAAAPGT